MTMLGVTGTNGKTTVTHLLEAIERRAGVRPGTIGTTGARVDGVPRAEGSVSERAVAALPPARRGLVRSDSAGDVRARIEGDEVSHTEHGLGAQPRLAIPDPQLSLVVPAPTQGLARRAQRTRVRDPRRHVSDALVVADPITTSEARVARAPQRKSLPQ